MEKKLAIVGTRVAWNKGEMLENIRKKQEELRIMVDIPSLDKISIENLTAIHENLEVMCRKIAKDEDMAAICELAKRYIEDEQHQRKIVLCKDCSCKKAVQIGRVMAWRCPYSTVDVDLNGFCHRGVKMNEDLGRS